MNNAIRREIYLERNQGGDLTPAQRRRLRKHQNIEDYNVVRRASRMRKALERRDRKALRGNAVEAITAMRHGIFRPKAQRALGVKHAMDVLKRAVGK